MACIYMPHPAGAHDLYVLFKGVVAAAHTRIKAKLPKLRRRSRCRPDCPAITWKLRTDRRHFGAQSLIPAKAASSRRAHFRETNSECVGPRSGHRAVIMAIAITQRLRADYVPICSYRGNSEQGLTSSGTDRIQQYVT
jgi:hypothetical protein